MSGLTFSLSFQFVKIFHKLFVFLGLLVIGASWQQLLPIFDTVTGKHMSNQLLINARREKND